MAKLTKVAVSLIATTSLVCGFGMAAHAQGVLSDSQSVVSVQPQLQPIYAPVVNHFASPVISHVDHSLSDSSAPLNTYGKGRVPLFNGNVTEEWRCPAGTGSLAVAGGLLGASAGSTIVVALTLAGTSVAPGIGTVVGWIAGLAIAGVVGGSFIGAASYC